MVQFTKNKIKSLGLKKEVFDALPTAVVGGAWEGSFQTPHDLYTALVHVVPSGLQLSLLFLRVWTQEVGGAVFSIVQTNPSAAGQTGSVEAYKVMGSVPPFTAGLTAARDHPMLEEAGAEVLRGGLRDPIHVLEGSINFNVLRTPDPPTGARYSIDWWGVQQTAEE